MKAIILAAGRGSRLKFHTQDSPKCLVKLAGLPLLEWQLKAIAEAGIKDIAVVCGYQAEKIKALAKSFVAIENSRWEQTNMLSSLLCAAEWAGREECIISYSDIVYSAAHLQALMKNEQCISITYDKQWEKLWKLRLGEDFLLDAETFREENGILKEIGNKPQNVSQVNGQYMGLIKLTPKGWEAWLEHCHYLGDTVDKKDMTGFLRQLVDKGVSIGTVPVNGGWCEVDSDKDLELYEANLSIISIEH
ncbi:MAG: phosphocholine cytidylyltransferase family protein [Fibromonadales bacterium]|nr:phosphocholine cytidylyltransferase family protein [Fibromonadales bacterium]